METLLTYTANPFAIVAYGSMLVLLVYSIVATAWSRDLIRTINREQLMLTDTAPGNARNPVLLSVLEHGPVNEIHLLDEYGRKLRAQSRKPEALLVMVEQISAPAGLAWTVLGLWVGFGTLANSGEISAALAAAMGTTFLGSVSLIISRFALIRLDQARDRLFDAAVPIIRWSVEQRANGGQQ
jgi:hypothetical protein